MDRYGVGTRVRHWRRARGWSQARIALAVGRSRPGISRIEEEGIDSFEFLVDLCRALNVTLHQFFAAPVPGASTTSARLAELDEALGIDTENAPSVMIARTLGQKVHEDPVLVLDHRGAWQIMERRDALKHAGRAVLIAIGGGMPTILNPDDATAVTHALRTQAVNVQALAAYRDILATLRRAEDQLGSHPSLLRATEIHLNTLQGWLGSRQPPSIMPSLIGLAAEYGRFAGWIAHDGANPARAVTYYMAALERAQMLGDQRLVAYVLACMAQAEEGSPKAVRHAWEGMAAANTTRAWQMRSLANERLARQLAVAGQREPALAAIERAADELGRADGSDRFEASHAYYFNEARISLGRGFVMTYVGRQEQAREALDAAAAKFDPRYARGRTALLVTLAESHAAARDVPEACRVGCSAVASLRSTSSARLTRRLRGLHRRLVAQGATAPVRELGDHLAAL